MWTPCRVATFVVSATGDLNKQANKQTVIAAFYHSELRKFTQQLHGSILLFGSETQINSYLDVASAV